MGRLSSKEEQRLVDAVARSIEQVNSGSSPNDAIEKVAREEKYNPNFIRQMVAAFNKSASIAKFTKEASPEKRKDTFELADAQIICRRIFPPIEKTAEEVKCETPSFEIKASTMEKAATALEDYSAYKGLSYANMISRIDKCRSAHNLLSTSLKNKEAAAMVDFEETVDKLVKHSLTLAPVEFQKFARLTVNGFPMTGEKMLKLISIKSGRALPSDLQKTASAAVFPAKEPYFSLASAHLCAESLVRAHRERDSFSKYAEGFVSNALDSLGSTISDAAGLFSSKDDKKEVAKAKTPELDLDPQFFNALKEVDSRKAFADLALYDPDLKQHDIPTLIGAFNSAVQSVPEAATNPPALKTLMLQRINTGNLQDTFQIGQEQALGKNLQSSATSAKAALDMLKEKLKAKTEGAQDWWEKEKKPAAAPSEGLLSKLLAGGKGEKKEEKAKPAVEDTKRIERLIKSEMTATNGKPLNMYNVIQGMQNNAGVTTTPQQIDKLVEKAIKGEAFEGDEQKIYDAFQAAKSITNP